MPNYLQMASSNRGRGSQRGRGRGGRLYSPEINSLIDTDGFTIVTTKRGGYIESSSTMADIVAKDDMTDYIQKEICPHICYIEQEDYNLLEEPLMVRKEYFSPYQAPTLYGKPRGYFETILQLSDCMTITHTRENPKDNSNAIVYSKVIIKKLVKPGSWGFDLTTAKLIKIGDNSYNYTYWDYQSGFYQVFLYQNPENKHTWFIKLCPQIIKNGGGIPIWFYEWWTIYGPEMDILPSNIIDAYQRWVKWHPLIRGKNNLPKNHNMIVFFIEYGIPWILKWDFCIQKDIKENMYSLKRQFWVRWWNNFPKQDIADLFNQINQDADNHFSQYQVGKEEVSTFLSKSSLNPFDLLKDQIKSENPNISEYELMKKCMFFFKDQFSSNFCKDDSSMGSGSNKGDTDECILAGESQDPEDDLDDNIEDQEYHELASF